MFVTELDITKDWSNTVSNYLNDEDTFMIVNNSPDIIYAVEMDTTPSVDIIGIPIQPSNYITYKKGGNNYLYLKNGYSPVIKNGVDTQPKVSRVLVNKVG